MMSFNILYRHRPYRLLITVKWVSANILLGKMLILEKQLIKDCNNHNASTRQIILNSKMNDDK